MATTAFLGTVTGDTDVRLLGAVRYEDTQGREYFTDSFSGGSLADEYSVADWSPWSTGGLPDVAKYYGGYAAYADYGSPKGVTITPVKTADPAGMSTAEILIVPDGGVHNGTYRLWFRLDATDPVATDGYELIFTITGATGVYSGTGAHYEGGVNQGTQNVIGGTTGVADAGWLTVTCTDSGGDIGTIKAYWNGKLVLNHPISGAFQLYRQERFGFAMTPTVEGGRCMVGGFRTQYHTDGGSQQHTQLVSTVGDNFSIGKKYNEIVYIDFGPTGVAGVTHDGHIDTAERMQKLYIADHGVDDVLEGTPTHIYHASYGFIIGDTTLTQFLAAHRSKRFVCTVSGAVGNDTCLNGTHPVLEQYDGDTLDLSFPSGGSPDYTSPVGAMHYVLSPSPKVYDPANGDESAANIEAWVSGENEDATGYLGTVPLNCPLVCTYNDRMVLAGNPENPHVWYMSRQGDPNDWDLSVHSSDPGRAVAATGNDTGSVGEAITALIPFTDDYLIFGCTSSIWRLVGDPTYGGTLASITHDIGILSQSAWCTGPSGELYFLSRGGLYILPPGAGATPIPASDRVIPESLKMVDPKSHRILMAYEVDRSGIHIYLTPENAEDSDREHWFFDLDSKGYWPISLPNDLQPTAILEYQTPAAIDTGLLLGCRDGYIRRYEDYYTTDSGTAIDSYVLYGPIRGGKDGHEGIMTLLEGSLSTDSGAVDWEVFSAETAERAASETTALASGRWSEGLNAKDRPRIRGRYLILKLSGVAGEAPWSIEEITGQRRSVGVGRK